MTTTRRIPLWLVIAAVSVPAFMASLDNLVVTSALPVMQAGLDASIEQLQWFINGFSLAFASLILIAVAAGDRWGRKRVFLGGIALFTLASVACAVATTPEALIVARVIQGAGGAAVLPLSLPLLAGAVPRSRRALAIGIWGGVAGLGVALGPLIGGAVVEGLSWHAIFWLNVPVGLIALPLAWWALDESRGRRARLDLVGLALSAAGVFGLVFGIVRGNDTGWTSGEVLAGLIGGGALLLAFVGWEARTRDPLIPLGLFRDRSFTTANVVVTLFNLGIFGSIFILIQFLQVVQGRSPLQAGVMTMPWTLAPLFIAPLTGLLVPRVGTRVLMVAGTLMQALGLAWIAFVMDPDVAYGVMAPAFLLAGVGMALVFAPSASAVLANMAPHDHAKATGVNSTLREIGGALGVAALTAVFTGAGGEFTPSGYTDAAAPAIWVGAGVLLLASLAALALPEGKGVPADEAPDVDEDDDDPLLALATAAAE
ncbi:DHA2 family efflux MFS transporter permease subunit [Demequina capsici]|uniref:DHA2 family efflux MFS transporter permease subunit n=1 Tax=Demequina capsici TaxID=3075620 RepID=A0AA96F8G7_9MICO|nr:DHA2 family efflux MFS transporter permease subunit [Demequina sp. OYTSA14]WNM23645.1 DHA2 family efflux MFS transporter permease subunit [Demequina sp. OYTSA14]